MSVSQTSTPISQVFSRLFRTQDFKRESYSIEVTNKSDEVVLLVKGGKYSFITLALYPGSVVPFELQMRSDKSFRIGLVTSKQDMEKYTVDLYKIVEGVKLIEIEGPDGGRRITGTMEDESKISLNPVRTKVFREADKDHLRNFAERVGISLVGGCAIGLLGSVTELAWDGIRNICSGGEEDADAEA